jgi:hypothetical protein
MLHFMRTLPHIPDSPAASGRRAARARLPRGARIIAGALAAVAALALLFGARSPGGEIRGDLIAAGDALRTLPATASPDTVTAELQRAFAGRGASIDASGFPAIVRVTLPQVERQGCVAAAQSARRIEGRVVIELEGYGSADACGPVNAMTWRLMP